MDLGFSVEHVGIRDEFRKALADADPRAAFEGGSGAGTGDAALWRRLAESGWLATLVPEAHGGSGLEPQLACLLAQEAGRRLAAVPFTASACAFTHGLSLVAERAPFDALFRALADGSARGLLLTEDCWQHPPQSIEPADGQHALLSGHAVNVLDGATATHALALAGHGAGWRLVLLELTASSRKPQAGASLDLLHPCASFELESWPVQLLARGLEAQRLWERMVDSQALFIAFEQLGGAEAALEAARVYSLERYAFGRPIGSFQALKHLMADMLVSIDLARSNCYFGAAALSCEGDVLSEAAAVARISATEAFRACAIGSTQVHGALGVTWESDCHLFYRRAQSLAGSPGSVRSWKERLVALLKRRANDAAPSLHLPVPAHAAAVPQQP